MQTLKLILKFENPSEVFLNGDQYYKTDWIMLDLNKENYNTFMLPIFKTQLTPKI